MSRTRVVDAIWVAAWVCAAATAAPPAASAGPAVFRSTGVAVLVNHEDRGNMRICGEGTFASCSTGMRRRLDQFAAARPAARQTDWATLMGATTTGDSTWAFFKDPDDEVLIVTAWQDGDTARFQFWPINPTITSNGRPPIVQSTVAVHVYGSGASEAPVVEYYGTATVGSGDDAYTIGMRTMLHHTTSTRVAAEYYMTRQDRGEERARVVQGTLTHRDGLPNLLSQLGLTEVLAGEDYADVRNAMAAWPRVEGQNPTQQVVVTRNRTGRSFSVLFQRRGDSGMDTIHTTTIDRRRDDGWRVERDLPKTS